MNRSTFSLLLALAVAALFLADAKDMQADNPPSGLRRATADNEVSQKRESWLNAMQSPVADVTCPCSCPNAYGRQAGVEQDAGEGVLVQLIPIPGSPPSDTQACMLQETVTPVMLLFPFLVWCVPLPCPE